MENLPQRFAGIKQEIVEKGENLERNLLLPAGNVLSDAFFQNNYDSSDNSSTKSRITNESPEARARRLARNAERMREKRANETMEEYRIRLAKNAEANRRKRQMENEMERAMRQVKDAARQRLRRAMETPEQRSSRLAKLAERMRMVRANETLEQRSERLKRSAARARERLSRESSEERKDRLQKRAEYARKMRAINVSDNTGAKIDDSLSPDSSSSSIRSELDQKGTTSNNTSTSINTPIPAHSNNTQQQNTINNHTPQDYPQSNNLVTLNNVKGESQFNQFGLHQNPLFLDLRSGNYLNVPSYSNTPLNIFPDAISSQVPPHLQNYVQSLSSLPIHATQLGVLPNPNCFPVPANPITNLSQQSSSVIQAAPATTNSTNSFLGQHNSPFQTQPNQQYPHPIQSTENFQNNQPPRHANPIHIQNITRIPTPESNSNDSMKQRIRGRPCKIFADTFGNPIIPGKSGTEMKDEVERQKVMTELLEEQISIILSSPKRHRGRPSKGRETDEERLERLKKMADGRRLKRANESAEARQQRLQMLTDRARQRREVIKATETEDERKMRLARQAEYARRRRLKEQTPDAKSKLDQRAKELYARMHARELKKNNERMNPPPEKPAPTTVVTTTDFGNGVKLRIPNPNQRDVSKLNSNIQSNLFEPIVQMQTN